MPKHQLRITVDRTTPDHPTFTIQLDPQKAVHPVKTFRNIDEFGAILSVCGVSKEGIKNFLRMLETKDELNEVGDAITEDGAHALSVPNPT